MWVAEIVERAFMSACANMDVSLRASRVDNEPASEAERKDYPALAIAAASGNMGSTEGLFIEVPFSLLLVTHYADDPKRSNLAALETQLWTILEGGEKTEFDEVAATAGATRYYKGMTQVAGSDIAIVENKEQIITINGIIITCGS